MAIGVSFIPQPGQPGQPPGDGGAPDAIQQAIKILSLRLPRMSGAPGATPGAVAPSALLASPGGSALGGGMDIDRLVQQILAGLLPSAGQPGAATSAGAPAGPMPGSWFPGARPATVAPPAMGTPMIPAPRVSPVTQAPTGMPSPLPGAPALPAQPPRFPMETRTPAFPSARGFR